MLAERSDKTLRIPEHLTPCSTRERGRSFYPILREWVNREEGDLRVTFEGVDFVSPSFLDETIVRLVQEQPRLADRLTIVSLKPMASRRLKARLQDREARVPVIA